jgi:hypothetical protein
MNIKLSMPEILIIFSLMMYPLSVPFSILAFALGLIARIIDYLMSYSEKLKKSESINESVEEVAEVLKGLFNVDKD